MVITGRAHCIHFCCNNIYNYFYRRPILLKLTPAEQISFDKAETCHICKKELLTDKVRDHCQFTGQYRGAAHNSCNLQCFYISQSIKDYKDE